MTLKEKVIITGKNNTVLRYFLNFVLKILPKYQIKTVFNIVQNSFKGNERLTIF